MKSAAVIQISSTGRISLNARHVSCARAERLLRELALAIRAARRAGELVPPPRPARQLWLLSWRPPPGPPAPGLMTGPQESELAERIISARSAGADARVDEAKLFTSLWPLLASTARSMLGRAGTLSREDLVQEGFRAILGALPKYKRARGAFAPWAQREARHAMFLLLEHQRSDVHLSDYARQWTRAQGGTARFGPSGRVCESTVSAISIAPTQAVPVESAECVAVDGDFEAGVIVRQSVGVAIRLLESMPRKHAEAVRRAFGLGRVRQTSEQIARSLRMSVPQVRRMLRAALTEMRAVMVSHD